MAGTTLEQALDEAKARSREALPAPAARRLLRELCQLSQKDLADALGVSDASISRWEAGLRQPRRAAHARYAAALRTLAQEVNSQPVGPATPHAGTRALSESR